MSHRLRPLLLALALVVVSAPAVGAFDVDQVFQAGIFVASVEGGGGGQSNLRGRTPSDLSLWYAGARLGWLPFGTAGPGPLRGALEIGIEPIYQRYTGPVTAYYAGLAAVFRYHFRSLGRLVPYLEAAAAGGGSNLDVSEIDSDFAFWLAAGAGASWFVSERTAIYAGYRLVHVSNAGLAEPNSGIEAHTGVAGVSYYFSP